MDIITFKNTTPDTKDLKLLIIAGIHGDEIGTIQLAYDLIHEYSNLINDPFESSIVANEKKGNITKKTLSASCKNQIWEYRGGLKEITIIPNCNMEAVGARRREAPYVNDLNRGWNLIDEKELIKQALNNADIVLDLHCSPDQFAGTLLFDYDTPDLQYILHRLDDLKINYANRATKTSTIKRYVNSFSDKLGFTWEQMGIGYINKTANEYANQDLNELIENISSIYWGIRTESTDNKDTIPTPKLSKLITCNTEGIIIPGPGIINDNILDGLVVDQGKEICHIESFDGEILEQFYAKDDNYRIIQIHSNKWANIGDNIALAQPF